MTFLFLVFRNTMDNNISKFRNKLERFYVNYNIKANINIIFNHIINYISIHIKGKLFQINK